MKKKLEYNVYHANASGFMGDPLIDTVLAEDEYAAVNMVAETEGINKNDLYAVQHIVSAVMEGEPGTRLEAFAYTDEDGAVGAEISVTASEGKLEQSVRISFEKEDARRTSDAAGKFVLCWNDEYLSMAIIGGPYSDMDSAADAMRKEVIDRLQALNVTETSYEAAALYEAASNSEDNVADYLQELHVSEYGASIRYGGGYEERYEIVDHKIRFCLQVNNPEKKMET